MTVGDAEALAVSVAGAELRAVGDSVDVPGDVGEAATERGAEELI